MEEWDGFNSDGKLVVSLWEKHFTLLPVRVANERFWFETVYRRKVVDNIQHGPIVYEYGTIMDVLKDS